MALCVVRGEHACRYDETRGMHRGGEGSRGEKGCRLPCRVGQWREEDIGLAGLFLCSAIERKAGEKGERTERGGGRYLLYVIT